MKIPHGLIFLLIYEDYFLSKGFYILFLWNILIGQILHYYIVLYYVDIYLKTTACSIPTHNNGYLHVTILTEYSDTAKRK